MWVHCSIENNYSSFYLWFFSSLTYFYIKVFKILEVNGWGSFPHHSTEVCWFCLILSDFLHILLSGTRMNTQFTWHEPNWLFPPIASQPTWNYIFFSLLICDDFFLAFILKYGSVSSSAFTPELCWFYFVTINMSHRIPSLRYFHCWIQP